MEILEKRIPSANGKHQLYCRVYLPDSEIKALFHVVHGMSEHIRRYDRFMRKMAEQGFVCFGFDNLGHGYTVNYDSELGHIENWQDMCTDVRNVSKQIKAEYGASLPCYLMRHSMGSFIVRCAVTPATWDNLIIMGTGGPIAASGLGLRVIHHKITKKGSTATAPEVEKLLFGTFNRRFRKEHDSLSWLSTIQETRDRFRADKYCNVHFSLGGFQTLLKLQTLSNTDAWFRNVSDSLPILLVSGADDPVGNYGKGVAKVFSLLKKRGKNVKMKLYPGCRHEILNDVCRDMVIRDILRFIND